MQTTTVSSSPEKESKLPKKRKDRRKHKHSESQDHIQTEAKHDVEAFIGTPLVRILTSLAKTIAIGWFFSSKCRAHLTIEQQKKWTQAQELKK